MFRAIFWKLQLSSEAAAIVFYIEFALLLIYQKCKYNFCVCEHVKYVSRALSMSCMVNLIHTRAAAPRRGQRSAKGSLNVIEHAHEIVAFA